MKEYKDYYDTGILFVHHWLNEKRNLEGEYKCWHDNGQLWFRCFFKNGVLCGEYKKWHEDGQLTANRFFHNNNLVDITEHVADIDNITEHEYFLLQITFGYFPIIKFDGKT